MTILPWQLSEGKHRHNWLGANVSLWQDRLFRIWRFVVNSVEHKHLANFQLLHEIFNFFTTYRTLIYKIKKGRNIKWTYCGQPSPVAEENNVNMALDTLSKLNSNVFQMRCTTCQQKKHEGNIDACSFWIRGSKRQSTHLARGGQLEAPRQMIRKI